ncbi:hypothetical protein ACU686_27590 [Yinghuangia aomiensis]
MLWIDVPPSAHAASTRLRRSSSMLAGRWNSPRVVTMFVPAASSRHTSSASHDWGMYSTQSAPSATTSSTRSVAVIPVGPAPHSSPASRPALAELCTYTPASSIRGCPMTWRNARAPMVPVAHCTTR